MREKHGIDDERDARACEGELAGVAQAENAWRNRDARLKAAERDLDDCVRQSRLARAGPRRDGEAPRTDSERVQDEQRAQEEKAAAAVAAVPRELRFRAVSARLCRFATWRERTLDAIAKERRYSAEAGVVNLSVLEMLKEQLRNVDDAAAAQRQKFAEAKAEPESCGSAKVAAIARCIELVVGTSYRGWTFAPDAGADCTSAEITTARLALER